MTARSTPAHGEAAHRGLRAAAGRFGTVLVGLLGLMVASALLAHAPIGPRAGGATIALALVQAGVIAVISMSLDRTTSLNRLTAALAFVFVAALFGFILADLFTRL